MDSVAIGPSIAEAQRAGIPVITLEIDASPDSSNRQSACCGTPDLYAVPKNLFR